HPGEHHRVFEPKHRNRRKAHRGLLKDVVPGIRRVAVLLNAANPAAIVGFRYAESAAKAAALTLDNIQIRDASDLGTALQALSRMHPDAVSLIADTVLLAQGRRIVEFMMANRLPAIYPYAEFAAAGGLISYSPDFDDLFVTRRLT